ncbi:MAG: hypothetical protein JEZ02_17475 [Desulfatibacillum sp.]|nr:hypothetical protein [Desulfatibacillum sp.]
MRSRALAAKDAATATQLIRVASATRGGHIAAVRGIAAHARGEPEKKSLQEYHRDIR